MSTDSMNHEEARRQADAEALAANVAAMQERIAAAEPSEGDEKRIDHVISALAALERTHGTRNFGLALKEFQGEEDYRDRYWAAMPEFRARCAEYDKILKQELGGDGFKMLTRPVTAEPYPPVELSKVYKVAREVANEPIPEDEVPARPRRLCDITCGETCDQCVELGYNQAGS